MRLRFDALGDKELSFKPAELAMLRAAGGAAGAAGAAGAEDDGEMERREAALRAESDALFKQLDRNGDGTLSRKEVTKGLQALEKSTGLKLAGKRAKAAFGYLDDGKDGEVNAEEFFAFMSTAEERAASDRLFKQLDRNGNGTLTRKEVAKGLAAMEKAGVAGPADASMKARAKAVVAAADASGGGKLDRNEFFKFVMANTKNKKAASFRAGDAAAWLKSDADVPAGSEGVVLGLKANGRVRLRFEQLGKEFSFKPAELVKLRAA